MSKKRRPGRGRLSSIDLLPPEASPEVEWAVGQLLANEKTQTEILEEFNDRLAVLGIDPISPSSFNRHSLRLAATTRRMKETQDITTAIANRLGPDKTDHLTIGVVTLLKQAAWEIAETGKLDPESVMFLSRSVQSLVAAQKTSADLRRQAQAEVDMKLKAAAKAVAAVGREHGMSAETVQAISSQILGVEVPA